MPPPAAPVRISRRRGNVIVTARHYCSDGMQEAAAAAAAATRESRTFPGVINYYQLAADNIIFYSEPFYWEKLAVPASRTPGRIN